MSCEICGRGSCCSSFHSIDEQTSFDDLASGIKERMQRTLISEVNNIDGHHEGDEYFINISDVIKIISDYY